MKIIYIYTVSIYDKTVKFLLPSIKHVSKEHSTIYIYASGYFENEKEIKLDLIDLAVNSRHLQHD